MAVLHGLGWLFVLLLLVPTTAAADMATDRHLWLDIPEGKETAFWAMGAGAILQEIAESYGCQEPRSFSGRTLQSASIDIMRGNLQIKPMIAVMMAYARLSGCEAAMDLWAQRMMDVKRSRNGPKGK